MATCNSWLWQVLNLHIAWICMDLWDKRRNTHRKLNESASVPTCISIQTVPPWICSISSHSSHMSETRGEPQDVPGLNIRPMPILPSLSWFPCTWQLHRHWLHVIFTLLHVMDHQCSKSDEEIPSISIPKRPRPGIPQCSLPRFYPLELEVPSNSWPVGLLLDYCWTHVPKRVPKRVPFLRQAAWVIIFLGQHGPRDLYYHSTSYRCQTHGHILKST